MAYHAVGCRKVRSNAEKLDNKGALKNHHVSIVRWPDGQRVYVVDAKNIGPYGRLTKPPGIDVIVIRHGNRWGVLPSSSYRLPARRHL